MFEPSPELHAALEALGVGKIPTESNARAVICNALVSIAQSLETLTELERNKRL